MLQFQHENQVLKSKSDDADDRSEIPCRRSQRLRFKELKGTHFLFETSQVTTPVNKEREVVLAYETPDQELLMLARHRQVKTKR